jgi:N,N'-diacetyllegionaminate synthase
MRVGPVDLDARVAVVAEIGNNHEGDVGAARELVHAAAAAGADAVKLQAFAVERFVSRDDARRFAQLARFQLSVDQYAELTALARSLGLAAGITPLDLPTAAALRQATDFWKVASGDNDFVPLIELLAGHGLPLVISTGASDLGTVERAVATARDGAARAGAGLRLAVLHCVSSYPAPVDQVNLRAIPALARRLGCTVGYSDHTPGPDAAPLAVALGARLIEKHLTLDRRRSGFRDHALSADPAELAELVRRVRAAEAMLGDGTKAILPCEEGAALAIRRSIVAARDLPAGHAIGAGDLLWLRPGGGIPPGREDLLLRRRLRRDVRAGERLRLQDVEEAA